MVSGLYGYFCLTALLDVSAFLCTLIVIRCVGFMGILYYA